MMSHRKLRQLFKACLAAKVFRNPASSASQSGIQSYQPRFEQLGPRIALAADLEIVTPFSAQPTSGESIETNSTYQIAPSQFVVFASASGGGGQSIESSPSDSSNSFETLNLFEGDVLTLQLQPESIQSLLAASDQADILITYPSSVLRGSGLMELSYQSEEEPWTLDDSSPLVLELDATNATRAGVLFDFTNQSVDSDPGESNASAQIVIVAENNALDEDVQVSTSTSVALLRLARDDQGSVRVQLFRVEDGSPSRGNNSNDLSSTDGGHVTGGLKPGLDDTPHYNSQPGDSLELNTGSDFAGDLGANGNQDHGSPSDRHPPEVSNNTNPLAAPSPLEFDASVTSLPRSSPPRTLDITQSPSRTGFVGTVQSVTHAHSRVPRREGQSLRVNESEMRDVFQTEPSRSSKNSELGSKLVGTKLQRSQFLLNRSKPTDAGLGFAGKAQAVRTEKAKPTQAEAPAPETADKLRVGAASSEPSDAKAHTKIRLTSTAAEPGNDLEIDQPQVATFDSPPARLQESWKIASWKITGNSGSASYMARALAQVSTAGSEDREASESRALAVDHVFEMSAACIFAVSYLVWSRNEKTRGTTTDDAVFRVTSDLGTGQMN